MGPIASPWTAILPSRRWLLLVVIPVGTAIAALPANRAQAPVLTPTAEISGVDDLAAIARAHRLWVTDHGPGCARSIQHFAPHVVADRWGEPLHFTCVRSHRAIVVEVTSAGPDRLIGTADDRTGVDRDER